MPNLEVKQINTGQEIVKIKDETARNAIGSGTLDTTAQNLIGAVNEVNAKKVPSSAGANGLRFYDETLEYQDATTGDWAEIKTGGGGSYIFSDTIVPVSLWTSDNTYPSYPYHADIPLSKVRATHAPTVLFSVSDMSSGKFADFAESGNGYIRIWSTSVPASAITIPTIVCEKNDVAQNEQIDWTSNTAGFHNSIYRGRSIQDYFTNGSLWDRINGTNGYALFEDLFIGDYFNVMISTSLGGTEVVKCVLADFDHFLHTGDTELTRHHAVVVPMDCFKTAAPMNGSHTTEGGYYSSVMHQTTLPIYAAALQTALSNHILTYRSLLSNAMTPTIKSMAGNNWDGASSNWAWYDTMLRLMTEVNVYGCHPLSSSFFDIGANNRQFNLFRHNPASIIAGLGNGGARYWYWLSAGVRSASFALVNYVGLSYYGIPGDSFGVRPYFLLGGGSNA